MKKRGNFSMATSDQMEKYLNKKVTYKEVEKMDKMLIRDQDGNISELEDVRITESEDGVGTMTYTAMHPHGGRGRKGLNKGLTCPHCGKTIDLRR
jgi:hypothetical protein